VIAESVDYSIKIQQLEKENRVLQRKLERAQRTCLQLEETNQRKECLLRQVISELQNSQTQLEEQRSELEQTLIALKRSQAQMQTEKMASLGQLVAGVAHEINNPINFIYGNLNHLQTYAQDLLSFVQTYQQYCPIPAPEIEIQAKAIDLEFIQKDLPKLLTSMQTGTERVRQIVLSLRNFARMDEAELKLVNLHDGIDSTLLILQHRLKDKLGCPAIQVVRDYGDLPLVECYAGQLNQVFMHILTNAIEAIETVHTQQSRQALRYPLGQITIRTATSDADGVWIAIADDGAGMSAEAQKQIFDPFFTTKPVGKGTGMGMSISYQIITETHGGKLTFSTSEAGTEFVIQLPVQQ
jgi:signal transduction histidine kinase